MTVLDRYMAIPYVDGGRDMEGCDCWGLLRLIYADHLNIVLPEHSDVSAFDLMAVFKRVRDDRKEWQAVKEPEPFDGVLMNERPNSPVISHIGIVTPCGRVMHTNALHGVRVQSFEELASRVMGVYRYAG